MNSDLTENLTAYRALPRFPVCAPCVRVCAPGRAGAHMGGNTPKPGNLPVRPKTGNAPPPDRNVTILKNCRCQDCRRWDDATGRCDTRGLVRYIPKADYEPAMRPFWSDLGMIRPRQWHYCSDYHGPQISKDVCVCSKQPDATKCNAAGPTGPIKQRAGWGNCRTVCFFRSRARTRRGE